VVELETRAGRALVACFPFLREGRVVDFMGDQWYGQYSDRVRRLAEEYAAALTRRAGGEAVTVLAAHFIVTGARVGGHGLPRGERELHMGEAYTAGESAIPPTVGYVAMGHIHAPQPVPAANVPAEYAGSLLQLDFGEAGEDKRVVIVDVEPGRPAAVRSVPIRSGRPLIHAEGAWADLADRADLEEAYLDLTVDTDGPDPGLADRARDRFPYLVRVRARFDRPGEARPARGGRPWPELYAEYRERETGSPPDEALAAAFREVLDAVDHAPT
jgi:exonuclease SbcD